jgi:DNA invertase Pin-like site-specific DNA recombinase
MANPGYVTIGEAMSVLIGYLRVSKADGSQIPDPQRDTLAVAGVSPEHLDEDHDSGRKTDRPGSAACLTVRRS